MNDFQHVNGRMFCENVPLEDMADQVGTPFYCYSHKTLTSHYKTFDKAFNWVDHIVCFAVKACSNIAILKALANLGAGADIVSGGELSRAVKAGMETNKIVYSGVGKTFVEIDMALKKNILMFNVESLEELEMISKRAKTLGKTAPVSLRINPDIDPKTHPYISTGLKKAKFGIDIKRAEKRYAQAGKLDNIKIVGVDFHIGSQITRTAPFTEAIERLGELIKALRGKGHDIGYLDIGGGLGIAYNNEEPPHPRIYADAIKEKVLALDVALVLEPGRVIAGNAGVLVTKVLYRKNRSGKYFVIVDAGMNDLLRPSLYDAHHEIVPVKTSDREKVVADIVGPICETGDFLARDREINRPEQGALLAVMSAGAYGHTMASNYNSRPRAPEILVSGDKWHIIRERETFEDLLCHEKIPEFLMKEKR